MSIADTCLLLSFPGVGTNNEGATRWSCLGKASSKGRGKEYKGCSSRRNLGPGAIKLWDSLKQRAGRAQKSKGRGRVVVDMYSGRQGA
jgi:hypothetical protein